MFGHRQAIDDGPTYPKGRPQENKNKSSTQTPPIARTILHKEGKNT